MLKLIFVRHGDYERSKGLFDTRPQPLTETGKRSVKNLGQGFIVDQGIVPDKIFTSPALRTAESAGILAVVFNAESESDDPFIWDEVASLAEGCENGEFSKQDLARVAGDAQTVLCVTHGPTIKGAVNLHVGREIRVREAEAVILEFEADRWADIDQAISAEHFEFSY